MNLQFFIRFISLFFCLTMMIASAKANMHEGIRSYENRHMSSINNSVSEDNINQAIHFFSNEINNLEFEEEAAIYLLKSYYYKGEHTTQEGQMKKLIFNKGKSLGEKYIAKYPESVALRYWYLVNLGSWAKVYGIITAAREGVADIMKTHSEKIIELDPTYADGGGYFMLGAVHYKSPYIPFLLPWPNNDDAIKYLQFALQIGSKKLNQKNYLAQALIKDGQEKEARILLIEVANTSPNPKSLVEDLFEINKANNLLEHL